MAQGGFTLDTQFVNFSKFGDAKSDGKTITLTQVDKWFKQAGVIDMRKVTMTDTGICFNKFKQRTINFKDFNMFIEELAKHKNLNPDDIREKLKTCGLPGAAKQTKAAGPAGAAEAAPPAS